MGSSGSFPVDLVLFGMIAAFLVLRLRSILGRRTGFERPAASQPDARPATAPERPAPPIIDGRPEPVASARVLPDPDGMTGRAFAQMQAIDRSLDPARFLAGAEAAFRLIVAAFAEGRRDALRPLLSDDTFRAFEAAIVAREAAGDVQQTAIRSIEKAAIEAAELRGTIGSVTVKFVSDQTNLTVNAAGQPVAGTDAVTEITDVWTFERDLTNADPTWRLAAARSA